MGVKATFILDEKIMEQTREYVSKKRKTYISQRSIATQRDRRSFYGFYHPGAPDPDHF